MNKNQAKALVQSELEENNLFYTEANLDRALQDIYNEVILRSFAIERSYSYALQAGKGYINMKALLPSFYRVNAIFNEQTKRWLDPVNRDALDAIRLDWELMTGQPRWVCAISPERICIVPKPAATTGTLTIFYNEIAPTLSGTTTFELPLETQHVVVKGSLREMQEQAREFKKAMLKNKEYQDLVKEAQVKVSRRGTPLKVYKLTCQSGQIHR